MTKSSTPMSLAGWLFLGPIVFVMMFVMLIAVGTGPILGIIGALWLTALLVAHRVVVLKTTDRRNRAVIKLPSRRIGVGGRQVDVHAGLQGGMGRPRRCSVVPVRMQGRSRTSLWSSLYLDHSLLSWRYRLLWRPRRRRQTLARPRARMSDARAKAWLRLRELFA